MRRVAVVAFTVLSIAACGPGSHEIDGGGVDAGEDDASVTDASAGDASLCADVEEGRFECSGFGRQCCGGSWHYFSDGPCWSGPDAGGVDASTPDCTASPDVPGCPCTAGAADVCRSFRTSLRCTDGVWAERIGVACCFF
jgi:hypothetical protein